MKNNVFGTLLEGALAFSVVFSAFMCIRLIVHTRDLRMYRVASDRIKGVEATVQLMIDDCVDYSRRNPAIDPILTSIHVNPGPAGRGAR